MFIKPRVNRSGQHTPLESQEIRKTKNDIKPTQGIWVPPRWKTTEPYEFNKKFWFCNKDT